MQLPVQQKKLILIVAGIIIVGLGAGGWFFFSSKQDTGSEQPQQENGSLPENKVTPQPTKGLSTVEKVTARSFAEKVLKLLQNRDYGKLYDLLTDEDKAAESRTGYVKRVTETSGTVTITSWQIKEVLEENSGASVQYVANYDSPLGSGSETGILTLVQKNSKWFLSIGAVDITKAVIKGVGDEVVLATIKYEINAVREQQTISNSYSTATAKEGTKFVVVDLSITNITNSGFMFPAEAFIVTDNSGRNFETYSGTFGNIENYLNVRNLPPSIPERGVVVYEIPTDATNYWFISVKAGTNDVYKVILK